MNRSESELLYDWRFTANQFALATSPLRLTTQNFFFQLNTFGYSPYVTSSLTRGWVCRLQLLLVLVSAVILGVKSRGNHDHILLSQIRDSPDLGAQVPVFISISNKGARLYPQAGVPFSSPLTTRRATVEVFGPASSRGDQYNKFSENLFRLHTFIMTIPYQPFLSSYCVCNYCVNIPPVKTAKLKNEMFPSCSHLSP
jgi:hypothetical protein